MEREATTTRCGDCFAVVHGPDYRHDCQPLPLSTARESTVTWLYLNEPDETDLIYATYHTYGGKVLLQPCPFCGSQPGPPTTKVRPDNGMVQVTVACHRSNCGGSVFSNGLSKPEAHARAVAQWNDRRPQGERNLARQP
jgi:hypothetical protein